MKRLLFLLLMLVSALAMAQAPKGFSYQAVIRNSNGQPIANQSVKVHILLTDKQATITYYEEQHTTLTTNVQGVANLIIGEGTLKQGALDAVPWQSGEVYIKVEVDPTGTSGYQAMGQPSKLYSVPYALFAENAKEVVSQPTALDDDPIFVVKNKAGQIVFAVYQTGVRVFVEDSPTIKGARGGFAVGGLSQTKAGNTTEYFRITPDSARIYTNKTNSKGARGGFAVGGLSQTKIAAEDYLQITPDSARIYINNSMTKGARGGFAVGGLSQTKVGKTSFFNIETNNTSIIYPSQARILWYPLKNAFLVGQVIVEKPDSVGTNSMSSGYESKAIGNWSQALGYKSITKGNYSTAIGNSSIAKNDNAFAFGVNAIAQGVTSFSFGDHTQSIGSSSFAIGYYSKANGDYSIAMGFNATSGYKSFAVGHNTTATGLKSVAIGSSNIASGETSIAIGHAAHSTENSTVAIGRNSNAAGYHSMALGISDDSGAEVTSAYGMFSYALGKFAVANGNYATAIGYRVKSDSYQGYAIGRWNVGGGDAYTWRDADPLFEIGNGSSANSRKNALTVYKNGDINIGGKTTVTGSVELPIVTTSINMTLSAAHYTVLVEASGVNIYLPSATSCQGRVYVIKYVNASAGEVNVSATTNEKIDALQTQKLTAPWQKMVIQSNGANWYIIN